jgi:ribonuclease HI
MSGLRFSTAPYFIHTDGACLKNPGGQGGWAAVIKHGSHVAEISGAVADTTNNRMELTACLKALETLPEGSDVFLFTDSRYVQRGMVYWVAGWLKRGWKTQSGEDVANRDIWEVLVVVAAHHVITWSWVKGHNGDKMNERCDVLAGQAARSLSAAA